MDYKQDIFWNNIPYHKGRTFRKLGFLYHSTLKGTFLKDVKNPFIIWTGTGRIEALEQMFLSPKTQNKIRKSDLEFYFYLYEPLCAKIGDYNRSFYSEFPSNVDLKQITSDEFESIRIFVKNNNIKNFRIFTSDYRIELIKDNYPDLKISCLDVFLREMAQGYSGWPALENKISKKFWCGNWRYTAHRHIVASYMIGLDGTYTWNLKCSYDELKKNNWFDLEKLRSEDPKRYKKITAGVEYLYDNVLSIDIKLDAVNVQEFNEVFIPGSSAPQWSIDFLQSYRSCFCAVVNETRYAQPFGYFSEKTLTAMFSRLPFVLVAPPKSLQYLKELGFKTFDRWWDESYDQEEDHYRRILKIFDIIDYINSKSIEELKTIYSEMTDILEHNISVIKSLPYDSRDF